NALFRCVHTIKGSAGMFGFSHVVEFTHVVENVLDRLRGGEIVLTESLAALLLRCRDHIAALVEVETLEDEDLRVAGEKLLGELASYQEAGAAAATGETDAAEPSADDEAAGEPVESDAWHVSVRFDADVLRHGMDPLGFVRYLGTLGELASVTTVADALPALEAMDPESCYLGFEIDLKSDADKAAIEDAFEFVRELCDLRILPPRSRLGAYMQLLEELPEDADRLGEMLVASGALTAAELDAGLRLQAAGATDEGRAPLGEVLVGEGMVQAELVDAALSKQGQVRERKKAAAKQIRVSADKLDELINLVGELVIASSAVALNARNSGDTATQEAAAAMNLLVEDIRDGALQLRMVPIGETFQRFQRVVRDVSSELRKDIRLAISGADTELDKTVVEKIGDPLTHLVRNACDHGIEGAEARVAKGKPAQGTLALDARHDSGSIVIEVRDDGNGLNRDKILAKAVERGLVAPDAELSDREIHHLIFEPGFSTADAVTNLSGRGVGMDVVRKNIEALRGTVEVESRPGQGTTFRIRLPLTLAIIDGFLMNVGDDSFVVPLEYVDECIELAADDRRAQRGFVDLRGEVLPLIVLRRHFRLGGRAGRRENVVVVRFGAQKVGLVVDALQGEQQTVIKPLGELFRHLSGISGSTILGNGRVALIIDVPGLVQFAERRDERRYGRTVE
ncbi:MAG: chemotaxis protein CheA, partial [Pseudomonadales bacterium]|nr:chemotaxis protein CheA [Pseudomonadales bacterium]